MMENICLGEKGSPLNDFSKLKMGRFFVKWFTVLLQTHSTL